MMKRPLPWAIVLLLCGGMLGGLEYHAAKNSARAIFDRTISSAEYQGDFTSEPIEGGEAPTTRRVRIRASLENAWMHVVATVVQADGSAFDSAPLYIDEFQAPRRGIHWRWGTPVASALLTVPAAGYRLSIHVAPEPANAKFPPLRVELLPAVVGSTSRLIGCAVATVLGLSLLFTALAPAKSSPRISRNVVIPAPAATPSPPGQAGIFPAGRLHFIDGLRGLAAVSVLLCHLFVPEFLPSVKLIEGAIGNFIPDLFRFGMLGVEIFFVLSGFVIAYSISNHPVTPGFVVRFIGRRFLRLDPPYYVAIFLAILLMAYSAADSLHVVLHYFQGAKGLLINALYLQDILAYRSPVGTVTWTLCLEVQFYLALVILTGISHAAGKWSASRVVWWLLLGSLGVVSFFSWYPDISHLSFLHTWYRFFLGVLTFRCLAARSNPRPFVALLALMAVVSVVYADPRGFTAVATAGLILFAGRVGALGRWLDGRTWQVLGRLSYSLYLYHVVLVLPFLSFVWSRVPHTLTFAVLLVPLGIIMAIACAWVMYQLIERPSMALSHRVRYGPSR